MPVRRDQPIHRPTAPGFFRAHAKSPHMIPEKAVPAEAVLPDLRPPSRERPGVSRRPVIAVIDTVIRDHPWLRSEPGPDPFLSRPGVAPGWSPPELRTAEGGDQGGTTHAHGTFTAGIIRQLAPEARVISLPVIDDFEHAESADVQAALQWVLDALVEARTGPAPELFIDVVNLSFGWHQDDPEDLFPESEYRARLTALADAGVRVVASAGNDGDDKPVYPAAFADDSIGESASPTQVMSVGALDPNGERAHYSNHGGWVKLWAPGTGLVSTVPVSEPNPAGRGFARWSGTSFAAAWVSAKIAHHLAGEPDLDDLSSAAVQARAHRALESTKTELAEWHEGAPDAPG